MNNFSRRMFLKQGALGLAAIGAAGLLLRPDAYPTESSSDLSEFSKDILERLERDMAREAVWAPTKDTVSNPYYIKGAPYRAKICPPLEPGQTLLISGRIWAYDTREPLPNTIIDIWHADSSGQYSGYEQHNPTERHTFYNRGRLITDNTGYYEYETIHPGHHEIAHDKLRPSHIHYLVWSSNYKTLNTQLYFKDDPNNETDHLIKESLIIDLRRVFRGGGFYEEGNFDIVLEPLPK